MSKNTNQFEQFNQYNECEEYFSSIIHKIDSLTVYKNTSKDRIIQIIKQLCTLDNVESLFSELCSILIENAEKNGFRGNLLKKHIINLFLTDENTFSLYCENNIDVKNSSLYRLALNDINVMKELSNFKLEYLPIYASTSKEILNYLPVNSCENEVVSLINTMSSTDDIVNTFIKFYNTSGCGSISHYKMFKYDIETGLVGIPQGDPITFDDIIGYKAQTKQLIDNTEAFVKGYQANNVLLVGSRGTGKSSSVKALANKFYDDGLRLIEITKEQIEYLPKLLALLKTRGRRFIIFIDDLSFDEQEIQYKYMKSLLDGGSESKPENVLFYATSNRRHLIQEKWSDRARGFDDEAEIHTQDTLNEKLSLADRFGITITFPKPTPQEYQAMVVALAEKQGINISEDELKKAAMRWEISQKGMSGRTAKQFINNLIWELSANK